MIRTLHDHLIEGGAWPGEIAKVERHGVASAVCTCGRVRSPRSIYHLKPRNVAMSERLPGRIRRSRMSPDRLAYAAKVAAARAREPEMSPEWACNVCLDAMRVTLGLTPAEMDRRLGHEAAQ